MSITKILTIVPCGQSKIWKKHPGQGPTKAESAYTGPSFKVNRKFAEKFSDKWLILSAKHGFIEPTHIIQDYNVTFKKPLTKPISVETLKKQLKAMHLEDYDIVIALGGKDYSSKIREVFNDLRVFAPATRLRIGVSMKRIKSLLDLDTEKMLEVLIKQNE